MKKVVLLLLVLALLVGMVQVVLANPDPDKIPDTGGSCHMGNSAWAPGEGPGEAKGVKPGERGMYHVHTKDMPDHVGDNGYTQGAQNMDAIWKAHGCPLE